MKVSPSRRRSGRSSTELTKQLQRRWAWQQLRRRLTQPQPRPERARVEEAA